METAAPSSGSPSSSVENANHKKHSLGAAGTKPARQPSSSSSGPKSVNHQSHQSKGYAMSETSNQKSKGGSGGGNDASNSAAAKQSSSERMLQLLRTYASSVRPKAFTNVRVPDDYVTPCGQELGAWLKKVGKVRKRGKMPPKLEEELTGLGVVWDDAKKQSSSGRTGDATKKKTKAKAKGAKKGKSEPSVPIKREEAGQDDNHGAELAAHMLQQRQEERYVHRGSASAVEAAATNAPAMHPHHSRAAEHTGPDQGSRHGRPGGRDVDGSKSMKADFTDHNDRGYGHGHASSSSQYNYNQPYRALWAEINDDTTGRIAASPIAVRPQVDGNTHQFQNDTTNVPPAPAAPTTAPAKAPVYHRPEQKGRRDQSRFDHHHQHHHNDDDDDGFFPMADSFDNEYDPDHNPYLYNTSPINSRNQQQSQIAHPSAAHHPAALPEPPKDHHHSLSGGLSSLAEASALVEPAGPGREIVSGPSDNPINAAPLQNSNKRKRGQREAQSRGNSDVGRSAAVTGYNSVGGTSGSLPSGQSGNNNTTIRAESLSLPKLKGRGRPRCKRAEARLLHADVPLLPERNTARDAPWEEKFDLLQEYKRLYGTANIPTAFCSGEVRLGQWLATQRQARRKGTLSDERVALMEELGVVWKMNKTGEKQPSPVIRRQPKTHTFITDEPPEPEPEEPPPPIDNLSPEEEEHWAYMLSLLKKFRDREGHLYPTSDHLEEGEELCDWLRTMKLTNRFNVLGKSYIKRLAEVGVILDTSEDQWREFLELFKQYVSREGNPKVNQAHLERGKKLGVWVVIQRKHFREGRLSADRIKLLDDAGFDWDPHNTSWEKFYALSVKFAVREGHMKVRSNHQEDGEYLHRWLRRQKRQKVEGNLTEEQIRRMEQLPGWDWDLGYTYDDMFALLLRFKAKRGHINVPSKHIEEGKNLGTWLDKFKQDKRNGKLDPRIEETLNSLGVQWEILEAQWEQYYLLLLQFVEREGHADVMQRHEEEGERLGIWVATQRSQYKKGKLPQSRIERLEQIDFIWEKKRGKTLGRRKRKKTKKQDDEGSEVSSEGEKRESDEEEEEEIDYHDEFDLDLDGDEAEHLDSEAYHHDDHHHFYYDDGDFGHDAPVKNVGV